MMALPLLLPVLGAVAPALAARLAGGGAGAEVLGRMAGALIEEVTGVSEYSAVLDMTGRARAAASVRVRVAAA
ncbi:MAG: hypothetical protein AAFZ09_18305, partial [Pseudomonadota bacterium]